MLLDNKNQNLKVHEWLSKYTQTGKMSVVTDYFTVGALAFFAKETQEKIDEYRFVLGDIVNDSMKISIRLNNLVCGFKKNRIWKNRI
jgi:hypothetical protein